MSKRSKLIRKILWGNSDSNIEFDDLCYLLNELGFSERTKGSHHIFFREGVDEIINIQPIGAKAKAYQVKQARNIIVKYRLVDDDE